MENEYKTNDLGLAAYLVNRGFILSRIETETGSSRKEFIFIRKRGQRIEDEAESFQTGEAEVNARRYFDDIKHVKNMMYSRY
jgi:hypothetical protein